MIDLDKELAKEEDANPQNEIYVGIFNPDIDKILWSRHKLDDINEVEYLIKFKDQSYLHVDWVGKDVILNTKTGKNKLNRFERNFQIMKMKLMS